MEFQRPGGGLGDEAATGDWFAHCVHEPATIAQVGDQPVRHPDGARRLPEKTWEIVGTTEFGRRQGVLCAVVAGQLRRSLKLGAHGLACSSLLGNGPLSISGSLGRQSPIEQCRSASTTAAERNHFGP